MSRKKRSLKQFTVYLTMALLTILLLCFYPFSKVLHPVQVTEYSELNTLQESDYINLQTETLYYTGCDYVTNKTIKGHYYYALSEKHCVYVLLKAQKSQEAQKIIHSADICCKLVKQEQITDKLSNSLANQVGWTGENLEKIVCPYIISELHYPLISTYLALIALCLQLLLSCTFAARSLRLYLVRKH